MRGSQYQQHHQQLTGHILMVCKLTIHDAGGTVKDTGYTNMTDSASMGHELGKGAINRVVLIRDEGLSSWEGNEQ